jgi:hypothetical protein
MLRSVFLAVLAAAPVLGQTASVQFSGFGHSGQATQPGASGSYNSGNQDTGIIGTGTHSQTVVTSDALASTNQILNTATTGDGTALLSGTTSLRTLGTLNDPDYLANKQVDHSAYKYIGFQVSETGSYIISGQLQMGAINNAPGGSGQYAYHGLGGGASLQLNNFPNPNTDIYTYNSGNIESPAVNSTAASFSTVQTLTAGTQYQLNFNSYMYVGFGGTGTTDHTSGWTVSVAPVPEPAGLLLGTPLLLALRRFRRA